MSKISPVGQQWSVPRFRCLHIRRCHRISEKEKVELAFGGVAQAVPVWSAEMSKGASFLAGRADDKSHHLGSNFGLACVGGHRQFAGKAGRLVKKGPDNISRGTGTTSTGPAIARGNGHKGFWELL